VIRVLCFTFTFITIKVTLSLQGGMHSLPQLRTDRRCLNAERATFVPPARQQGTQGCVSGHEFPAVVAPGQRRLMSCRAAAQGAQRLLGGTPLIRPIASPKAVLLGISVHGAVVIGLEYEGTAAMWSYYWRARENKRILPREWYCIILVCLVGCTSCGGCFNLIWDQDSAIDGTGTVEVDMCR